MTIFYPTMTRTIAYVRVSTERQADRGVSLDAQCAKITAYATLYEVDVVEVIVDAGESAKSLVRPGLQRALTVLRHGKADALLVTKLDRLTRSVRDLGDLVETYFADGRRALLSVGEQIDTRTAAGRLVVNVLGSVSQWERETIGERTRDALAHKRSRGEKLGGHVPYGFRTDGGHVVDGRLVAGKLAPTEGEQQVIRLVSDMRERGLSLRTIVFKLDEGGFVSRAGKSTFGDEASTSSPSSRRHRMTRWGTSWSACSN